MLAVLSEQATRHEIKGAARRLEKLIIKMIRIIAIAQHLPWKHGWQLSSKRLAAKRADAAQALETRDQVE